jgi:hypothetical protein
MKATAISTSWVIAMMALHSTVVAAEKGPIRVGPVISKISVGPLHSALDVIKQIKASLPENEKSVLIVEVPAAELAEMPVHELELRNVEIGLILRYLEDMAQLGARYLNGAWHVHKRKRDDDFIVGEYQFTVKEIKELGLVLCPGGRFETSSGEIWPSESPWDATYRKLDPRPREPLEMAAELQAVVLRVEAPRYYQDEIAAVQLLRDRGYRELALKR